MHWVSCTDKMPPENFYVLAVNAEESEYWICHRHEGRWDDGEYHDNIKGITHWMLLPDVPEKNA